MIISVSRRCDIPRFSFDWFLEKLDAGFVDVTNPFNLNQTRRVSLLPPAPSRPAADCAEIFAFWTRDPASILKNAEELEKRGYGFYVMFTLTSYPAMLEPNVPSAGEVIDTVRMLARKITPERVIWRYDPVFLSDITDFDFHRRNFTGLAAQLNGVTGKVIVSVYDEYARAERRLADLENRGSLKRLAHYSPGEGVEGGAGGKKHLLPRVCNLLTDLARIACREGMEIQSCAEEVPGTRPGACIDGEYIEKVFGLKVPGMDRSRNRPGCLCAQSGDIGNYGICPAGCVYCYAS